MGSIAWLLLPIVAGIFCADRGLRIEPVPALAVAVAVGLGAWMLVGGAGRTGGVGASRRAGKGGRVSLRGSPRGSVLALVVALGGVAGSSRLEQELALASEGGQRVAALDSEEIFRVDARVRARRSVGRSEEIELVEVRALRGAPKLPERVVLRFVRGERGSRAEQLLWPGVRARLALRFSPLAAPRNPGLPDLEQALARRGIGARARLVKPDWVVVLVPRRGSSGWLASVSGALRAAVVERVAVRLDGSVAGAGLARSLALGDRRELSDATRDAVRALGLAHLVSVSGLHIGFVALPAGWLVERLRIRLRPRTWPVRSASGPVLAAAGAATAYAWITGASLPTQRACLLFVVFGGLRLLRVKLAPGAALAGVAWVLLLADPANLFDLGAQLSFGACAALLVGGLWGGTRASRGAGGTSRGRTNGPRADRRTAFAASLHESARASLAISLFCLPLVEGAAIPRALVSPIANLVAIPFAGLCVLPSALAAGILAVVLPFGVGDGVFVVLLAPAAWLEGAATGLVGLDGMSWLAAEPMGRLPPLLGLVAIASGLASIRCGRLPIGAAAWLLVGGLGLAPATIRFGEGAGPRVVFFDVGQADAALVTSEGRHWLIDSGPGDGAGRGGGALLRSLRALGVDRLEALVVTHGDLDHRGGAERILLGLVVEELWLPDLRVPDAALERLAERAAERGTRVRRVGSGDRWTGEGGLRIEVLWPIRDPAKPGGSVESVEGARAGAGRNAGSVVLRIALAGRQLLFMGDVAGEIEDVLVQRGSASRADVLKVAHHGSGSSTTSGFLIAVAPRIAIVSAPCWPTRGLPSPEALARLRRSRTEIGWTGRDGAIALEWAGPRGMRMRNWGRSRECERGGAEPGDAG